MGTTETPGTERLRATLARIGAASWEGYLDLPLPGEADAELTALLESYASGDDGVRAWARTQVGPPHARALSLFAIRMASLAVRERSVQRLRLGLWGAVLSEGASGDWRETSSLLAPLADAARRIGADAKREFAEAARLGPHESARVIAAFPPASTLRGLAERAAMIFGLGQWRTTGEGDAFRYEPAHTTSKSEAEELLRKAHALYKSPP